MDPGVRLAGDCAIVGVPAEKTDDDDPIEFRPGGGISRRMFPGFADGCSDAADPTVDVADQSGGTEAGCTGLDFPAFFPCSSDVDEAVF